MTDDNDTAAAEKKSPWLVWSEPLEAAALDPSADRVLRRVWYRARSPENECWESAFGIGRAVGLSERAVQSILHYLETWTFIEATHQGGGDPRDTNRYRPLPPDQWKPDRPPRVSRRNRCNSCTGATGAPVPVQLVHPTGANDSIRIDHRRDTIETPCRDTLSPSAKQGALPGIDPGKPPKRKTRKTTTTMPFTHDVAIAVLKKCPRITWPSKPKPRHWKHLTEIIRTAETVPALEGVVEWLTTHETHRDVITIATLDSNIADWLEAPTKADTTGRGGAPRAVRHGMVPVVGSGEEG